MFNNLGLLSTVIDSLLLQEGYSFVNTFIYIIIVVSIYLLLFRFFRKKIKIDIFFVRSIIPFLLIGGALRIFEQEKYIAESSFINFFLRVPGLLIFLFVFYILCFLIAVSIKGRHRYYYYLEIFAYSLLFPLLVFIFIHIKNYISFFAVIAITSAICFALFFIFKKLFKNNINKIVLFSQALDSVATTYGIFFYSSALKEAHVVSEAMFSINPFLFLVLKLGLIVFILHLIDNILPHRKPFDELKPYKKTLLIIHGLLIGFRTLLTICLLI